MRIFTSRRSLLLLAVTLGGLLLRLWHIRWGAPERVDLLPDEIDYVMTHLFHLVGRIEAAWAGTAPWTRATLDPVFLNYPSFLMYLIAAVWLPLKKAGLCTEPWQAYLVGRFLVALFGTLTIPVVYKLAKELGATVAGAMLAALWTALMPLHVWQSHIAVTDVLMTFWLTVALWTSLRLVRRQAAIDYACAGAAVGLATGAKYTAAMLVVPLVLGALAGRRGWGRLVAGLALSAFSALASCFVVTPYSFLRFHDTLAAMHYEYFHTHHIHYGFSVYAVGWQYHRWLYQLVSAAPFSLGFALYAASAAGILWVLFHGNRRRWILLAFCLVFYGVTGSWIFTPLRYYLPILIPAVACAGLWQGHWLTSPQRWQRRVAIASVGITLVYTAAFSLSTTALFGNDTRLQAGHWIDRSLPAGSKMTVLGWSRYCGLPTPGGPVQAVHAQQKDMDEFPQFIPHDYVQITSLEYLRHYRHGDTGLMESYDRLRDPAGPCMLVARFETTYLNESLYEKLDPMFACYFISPTIEIYRFKEPGGPAVPGRPHVHAAT